MQVKRKNIARKFLAGSFAGPRSIGTHQAPPQEPSIPLAQLAPSIAEIKVAEDALAPRFVVREGRKKLAPKKFRKPLTARQRYGLTRVEVAALLDKPNVESKLPPRMCERYRRLANRNVSIEQLAVEDRISATAMEAVVEGWESDIVAETCRLYPKFLPSGAEPSNSRDAEKVENESEAAQDADILKSKGQSIGGRIISGGKLPTGRPRKLSDFERSGRLREAGCDSDYDQSGSQISEEDDYSEDSRA